MIGTHYNIQLWQILLNLNKKGRDQYILNKINILYTLYPI